MRKLTLALDSRLLRSFPHAVQTAGGRFRHVPTGNARPQQEAAPAGIGGLWDGPEVSHVARAVRLVPSKSLRKRLSREQ